MLATWRLTCGTTNQGEQYKYAHMETALWIYVYTFTRKKWVVRLWRLTKRSTIAAAVATVGEVLAR